MKENITEQVCPACHYLEAECLCEEHAIEPTEAERHEAWHDTLTEND